VTENDVHDCARCGARTIGAPCDCTEDEPRHEQDRLFTPTTTMRGQTTLALD
jgi:hypothetical protein